MKKDILVLDAGFIPLGVVDLNKGMRYLMKNKGTALFDDPTVKETYEFEGHLLRVPSIVLLKETHSHRNRKRSKGLKWSKKGVLRRDGNQCAYCGEYADTIDHIKPKKHGGKNEWLNTVAACKPCNNKKDCKSLKDSGMKLRFQPYEPTFIQKKVPVNNAQRAFLVENALDHILS